MSFGSAAPIAGGLSGLTNLRVRSSLMRAPCRVVVGPQLRRRRADFNRRRRSRVKRCLLAVVAAAVVVRVVALVLVGLVLVAQRLHERDGVDIHVGDARGDADREGGSDNQHREDDPSPRSHEADTTSGLSFASAAMVSSGTFRCAWTSSGGVSASHWLSDTSAKWSLRNISRKRSVSSPVFST